MTKIVNLDESTKNSSASSMKIFENEEFGRLSLILLNDEPMFLGKEVASVLEYSNPSKAISDHVDEEDRKVLNYKAYNDSLLSSLWTGNDFSDKVLINESGLYSLILRSNMEKAKKFKRWITSDVLPSIRKTGKYEIRKDPLPSITKEEYDLRMKEVSMRKVEALERLRSRVTIPEFQSIADHYIMEELTGNSNALPLPEVDRKTYSATEIGKMFGVSSNKIGRLAKEHGLKTPEYGKLFYDKSKYSNKEVETFRYYGNAISVFRTILDSDSTHK